MDEQIKPVVWRLERKRDGKVRGTYSEAPDAEWREIAEINGDRFVGLYSQQSIDALRAEVEALRADAERYRWLRDEAQWAERGGPVCVSSGNTSGHAQVILAEDDLDASIDAARKGAE